MIVDIPYDGGDAGARDAGARSSRSASSIEEPHEPVGWGKCSGCGFFDRCWPQAVERRSVGLLPWVGVGLTGELERRGIETIDQLLERYDAERLAEVERPWGGGRRRSASRAERILAGARALAEDRPIVLEPPAIPEHPNYVMFDLEGMPPQLDELEKIYLWGHAGVRRAARRVPRRARRLRPRRRPRGLVRLPRRGRRDLRRARRHPVRPLGDLRATKINLYLDRYGDRDGIAARVKRNLLDLLPITYESVALPLSSYGLKAVELLAGYERQLEEYGGEWSMARYIEATETEDEARPRRDHGRDPRLQPGGPGGDLGGDDVAADPAANYVVGGLSVHCVGYSGSGRASFVVPVASTLAAGSAQC